MFPELPDRKELSRYLALGQVGLEMVAPIVLGLLLDWYVKWTAPWAAVGGAVLGLVGGFIHLVQMLNKMDSTKPPPHE
jgi:F0F1-type ATP synthase assembly protein I